MPQRFKRATEKDKERLEVLHEALENAEYSCSCNGESERCSYCEYEIDGDDIYICSTDYDTLELRVRLSNIDPKSKLARKYNLDEEFADIVDSISDELEYDIHNLTDSDQERLFKFKEAVEYLSDEKWGKN